MEPTRNIPPPEESYKLVRTASDRYRKAGARLDRARKAAAAAEVEYRAADRALRAAIIAVQPELPAPELGAEESLP